MIFNVGAGGASNAEAIKYNNAESGLEAANVQGAVDELNEGLQTVNVSVNEEGKLVFTDFTGADTVIPFKRGGDYIEGTLPVSVKYNSATTITLSFGVTFKEPPKVVSAYCSSQNYVGVNKITDITTNGCTVTLIARGSSGTYNETLVWNVIGEL